MTDRLSATDPHHWAPVPQVLRWLTSQIAPDARVLEIGPGTCRFKRADIYVDFVDVAGVPPEKMVKCDIATEPLPFKDKSFDFVVCRHVLEDMYNPFPICAEMSRVAHSGYVETPSPLAELCRGVDGTALPYRGYHHHRFMAWETNGTLCLISKYPLVEYRKFDDEQLVKLLKASPKYWNTYHLWSNELKVRHVQSPIDYDIPQQYEKVLRSGLDASIRSTDAFWSRL